MVPHHPVLVERLGCLGVVLNKEKEEEASRSSVFLHVMLSQGHLSHFLNPASGSCLLWSASSLLSRWLKFIDGSSPPSND